MKKVEMTAREWELFTSMPGADKAADTLNDAMNTLLEDIEKSVRNFEEVMYGLSEFGASDSEPFYHYRRILRDFLSGMYF